MDNRKTPAERRKAIAEQLFWNKEQPDPVVQAKRVVAAELRKMIFRLEEKIEELKAKLGEYE